MHREHLAMVEPAASLRRVMKTMTSHRTNLCLVMEDEQLCGIITDGDLRKNLSGVENLKGITARSIMNSMPVSVQEKASAEEARQLMEARQFHSLVVKDQDQKVVGLLTIGDLSQSLLSSN